MNPYARRALALGALWCLGGSPAQAHPTPGSVALLDFTVEGGRIEQDVPIEELERAMHQNLANRAEPAAHVVQAHEDSLRAYAAKHVQVTSLAGAAPWKVEVLDVTGHDANDGPRALFHFALWPPRDAGSASIHLHDDLVTHEVISHYTLVYLRSDWGSGDLTHQPRLVGTIHAGRNDVAVSRGGGFWRGFRSVVALGMEHIATGTDHLMFLFALVLVAPVVAQRGRWKTGRGQTEALLAIARVVSAFTVGHSATLALGAFAGVTLPAAVIEAAIAATILVTAIHAVRPIFPGREAPLACAFGLVHGMAFASALTAHDLGRRQMAWTLLGFNGGIELAQLALLALVVPWLLILARTPAYAWFRRAGAALAAVLATGWLLERALGWPNPTARPLAWLEAHPLPLLMGLVIVALLARASLILRSPEGTGERMPAHRLERISE